MLNKFLKFIILFIFPISLFAQYPDSGNKLRLGFQTTADGLIWRATFGSAPTPTSNKNTYVVLDTLTNKIYHYKNSAWTLVGGDTTSLSNRIDALGEYVDSIAVNFQDSIDAIQNGYFKQEFPTVTSDTLLWTKNVQLPLYSDDLLVFRNGQFLNNTQYTRIDTNKIKIAATSYKIGNNYTIVYLRGGGAGNGNQFDSTILNLQPRLDLKLNISDTASMLTPYIERGDTASMLNNYWRSGKFSGTLPVANGGTGSATQNFVDLTNDQTANGVKTFSNKISVGGSTGVSLLANPAANGYGGFWHNSVTPASTNYAMQTNGATVLINGSTAVTIAQGGSGKISARSFGADVVGDFGIGKNPPTARLHIAAGTATASTAPLKFESGTNLTTIEQGAMEFSLFNGANRLFISPDNSTRKEIGYADLSNITGTLPVANGGTGQTTLAAAGIVTGSGTSSFIPKYTATGTVVGNSKVKDTGNELEYTGQEFIINKNGSEGFLTIFGSTKNYVQFKDPEGAPGNIEFDHTDNYLNFRVNGINSIRINNTGNVGIGTTTPTSKLHVMGSGFSNTTSAFKVNNSIDSNLFNILDGGDIKIVGSVNIIRSVFTPELTGGFVGYSIFQNASTLVMSGGTNGFQFNDNANGAALVNILNNGAVTIANLAGIDDVGADANGKLQAATSDINLKNTIENSPFGLNEILLLNPVTFLYNDTNRKIDSDVKEVGFIAQDVFDIIPNAVSSTGTGDLQLDYRAITATLTKAIQEQTIIIKQLEERIKKLEER